MAVNLEAVTLTTIETPMQAMATLMTTTRLFRHAALLADTPCSAANSRLKFAWNVHR